MLNIDIMCMLVYSEVLYTTQDPKSLFLELSYPVRAFILNAKPLCRNSQQRSQLEKLPRPKIIKLLALSCEGSFMFVLHGFFIFVGTSL